MTNTAVNQPPAEAALYAMLADPAERFSALPGDLFVDGVRAITSISSQYELHAEVIGEGECGSEATILLTFELAAVESNDKPEASLRMDNHIQEVGVNDRHWISLSDATEAVANFVSEAKAWGVPPARIEKGVEYIGKCRAIVEQLGDRIVTCQLRG